MGDTEATTIDPELDPKVRAAAVDGTGAARQGVGERQESGDEDAALAEAEAKHGIGKGKRSTSSAPAKRSGSKPRSERTTSRGQGGERKPITDPNKPIRWSRDQRATGDIVRGAPKRQDQRGRFLAGEHGPEREFNETEGEPEEELEEGEGEEGEDEGEGEEQEHRGRGRARGDRGDPDHERDVVDARRALRRDGWTEDDLDGVSEETLIRIGLHRARNQRDIDRRFATTSNRGRERGFFGRTDQERETSKPDARRREDPDTGNASYEEDLEALETSLAESMLDEELGKKAAKAVGEFVRKHSAASASPERDVVLEHLMDERARLRLGERFPMLKRDDDLWDRISEKASVFYRDGVKSKAYDPGLRGIDEAFEDAARATLGDPRRIEQRRNTQRAVHAARENGSPAVPQARRDPGRFAKVKSREELEDLWLRARESNDQESLQSITAELQKPRFKSFG